MALLNFQEWILSLTEKAKSPDYSFDKWLKQTQNLEDGISSLEQDAKKKDKELDDEKTKQDKEKKEKEKVKEKDPKNQEVEWSQLARKLRKALGEKDEDKSSDSQKK